MGGTIHDAAVRINNADGTCGRTFVDDGSRNGAEMRGAAAIGDANGIGGVIGRGTYKHGRETKTRIVRNVSSVC